MLLQSVSVQPLTAVCDGTATFNLLTCVAGHKFSPFCVPYYPTLCHAHKMNFGLLQHKRALILSPEMNNSESEKSKSVCFTPSTVARLYMVQYHPINGGTNTMALYKYV